VVSRLSCARVLIWLLSRIPPLEVHLTACTETQQGLLYRSVCFFPCVCQFPPFPGRLHDLAPELTHYTATCHRLARTVFQRSFTHIVYRLFSTCQTPHLPIPCAPSRFHQAPGLITLWTWFFGEVTNTCAPRLETPHGSSLRRPDTVLLPSFSTDGFDPLTLSSVYQEFRCDLFFRFLFLISSFPDSERNSY